LSTGVDVLHDFNFGRHLHFVQLNVFALFNRIIASPSSYYLTDVTTSSQDMPSVDPDTYLFWDDLHPTTRGHNILATTLAGMIAGQHCSARLETDCASVAAGSGAH
jgi:phospholipase/lecithinase/hemolysin